MARGAEGASLTVAQTNGSPVLALSATLQGVRSAPTDTVGGRSVKSDVQYFLQYYVVTIVLRSVIRATQLLRT